MVVKCFLGDVCLVLDGMDDWRVMEGSGMNWNRMELDGTGWSAFGSNGISFSPLYLATVLLLQDIVGLPLQHNMAASHLSQRAVRDLQGPDGYGTTPQ